MRERFAETGLPCPCGKSSDAYCVREDGSGYCFGKCGGTNFRSDKVGKKEKELDPDKISYEYISHRGISRKTHEKYGVLAKIGVVDGEEEIISRGFPYEDSVKIKNEKYATKKEKYSITEGSFHKAGLFGSHVYGPNSRPSITIFEGEDDAMAGDEMLGGRSACVSLKSGSTSAFHDLSREDIYKYVDSFSKIYICFDNDEAGRVATKSIQGLFDFNKVYLVKITNFKDPNEFLLDQKADDFVASWDGAKRYAPDNIISDFSDIDKALEEQEEDLLAEYPFDGLNEKLFALYAGDVVVVKAQEGVGKTEFFRSFEHHVLKTTQTKIGVIHLEEDNATTIKALAGYELGVPATLPTSGLSRKDILEGYKKAVGGDSSRVHIYQSFDIEDEQSFYGNIRFLGRAAGCRIIFLDHISWLGTGLTDDDERKKLDRISQKLKLLAKELKIAIVMISHVNDEGKTRGSRNISKVANIVLSISRDVAGGESQTSMVVEKARLGGRTGPAGYYWFDQLTGTLVAKPPAYLMEEEDDGT